MESSRTTDNLSAFKSFPPLDLLPLILFSVATFGVYTWWWMYSRSTILNGILPEGYRIDVRFMHLCVGGFVVTLLLAIAAGFQVGNVSLENTVNILSLVLNVLVIVWVLHFRRGVHYLLGETETPYHMNLFWTLLFQVFYMQHKLNLIRAHSQLGVM